MKDKRKEEKTSLDNNCFWEIKNDSSCTTEEKERQQLKKEKAKKNICKETSEQRERKMEK